MVRRAKRAADDHGAYDSTMNRRERNPPDVAPPSSQPAPRVEDLPGEVIDPDRDKLDFCEVCNDRVPRVICHRHFCHEHCTCRQPSTD